PAAEEPKHDAEGIRDLGAVAQDDNVAHPRRSTKGAIPVRALQRVRQLRDTPMDLLERTTELETLEGALAAVCSSGRGSLVLVTGEARRRENAVSYLLCECDRD